MRTKIQYLLISLVLFFSTASKASQLQILGKWYAIDESGNRKSVVNIYKNQNGEFEGKIVAVLMGDPSQRCVNCPGVRNNEPFVGLTIITNMRIRGEKLVGGRVLNPENGKEYFCTLSINTKNSNLIVYGSIDKSGIIGKSNEWVRFSQ